MKMGLKLESPSSLDKLRTTIGGMMTGSKSVVGSGRNKIRITALKPLKPVKAFKGIQKTGKV